MTSTKIIKLNLEDSGSGGKLPALKDPLVGKAFALYRAAEEFQITDEDGFHEYAERVDKEFEGSNLTSDDIQKVYDAFGEEFQLDDEYGDRLGIIINALIQHSNHRKFLLKTKKSIGYIGYKMSDDKAITVDGDVGRFTGELMAAGKIHVKGNAGDNIGVAMLGGLIEVDGNAGNFTGGYMNGGKLIIGRNAGTYTGEHMGGGEIHVGGGCGEATGDRMRKGLIRVAGKIAGISTNLGEADPKFAKIYQGDELLVGKDDRHKSR
ncbi:MAG: hypothetical protein V1921_06220 [Candidatus Altiarchaeota archaeon]